MGDKPKCPECESENVTIIDMDSQNQIWIFRCVCGHQFTEPVE